MIRTTSETLARRRCEWRSRSSRGAARADLPDPVRFGIAVESGDVRAVQAWLDEGLPPTSSPTASAPA